MTRKNGRPTNKEKEFIIENAGRMKPDEIAQHLNRDPAMVRRMVRKLAVRDLPEQQQKKADNLAVRSELRDSQKWKRITQELTPEELLFFEEEYVKLMSQFQNDVLPSEETQIFDSIKYDVLKSRNMVERRKMREEVAGLEKMVKQFVSKFKDAASMKESDRSFMLSCNEQIQQLKQMEQDKTIEFVKFQERQDALMKSLKSTRDQRIDEVRSANDTVLSLLKALQKQDFRNKAWREQELMRMAAEKEYRKLGQEMEYDNGEIDRPILSADTVDLKEEKD